MQLPMKHVALAVALAFAAAASAQITPPEVQPDGRVTFRLRAATNAAVVQLRCEGVSNTNLSKDDQGVWSVTTPPLEPDLYVYSFHVDGFPVLDPRNPLLKYNLLNTENQLHVPGPKSLPWEINGVPRGLLHRHFYRSAVAGDEREFVVYTPPGYDPKARQRYPVLYLLHGFSDDTSTWTSVGRANVILDNLIARGQAKPMLVVMPLGYGTMEVVKAGWQRVRDRELWQRNVDHFGAALLGEVLPQVEQAYRVAADRQTRAIAGLSMGGTESLVVGLNHPDRFAWIGAFSSGGLNTNFVAQFPALDAKANERLRLLWIGCGREDRLIESNRQLCAWLDAKGVRYTWVETAGTHSFRVWRRYLAEFVPLLFQGKK
jgi:enterochelin esterase-like enzyme